MPVDLAQEPFHRRLAFDLGDVGIGQLTNSLELGCDCLGSIHYFDAVLNNSKGAAVRLFLQGSNFPNMFACASVLRVLIALYLGLLLLCVQTDSAATSRYARWIIMKVCILCQPVRACTLSHLALALLGLRKQQVFNFLRLLPLFLSGQRGREDLQH